MYSRRYVYLRVGCFLRNIGSGNASPVMDEDDDASLEVVTWYTYMRELSYAKQRKTKQKKKKIIKVSFTINKYLIGISSKQSYRPMKKICKEEKIHRVTDTQTKHVQNTHHLINMHGKASC